LLDETGEGETESGRAACSIPAARAVRIDPTMAMRTE
jgi:hypothetical protein